MRSDLNRRARTATPSIAVTLNWSCAVVAVWGLILTIMTLNERAPVGAIIAFLVLLFQVPCGCLPVMLYVWKHRPMGPTRQWLLASAIVGPSLSIAALMVTFLFFEGGC